MDVVQTTNRISATDLLCLLFCLKTPDLVRVRHAAPESVLRRHTNAWWASRQVGQSEACCVAQWVPCSIFFPLPTFCSLLQMNPLQAFSSHNDSVPSYCKNDEGLHIPGS